MDGTLENAREGARAIHAAWSARWAARKELAKLSPDARGLIEELISLTQGKVVSVADALGAIEDMQEQTRKQAEAMAMKPLVEWWESQHGPVTTTLYSNPKRGQTTADEGASTGLKFLRDEMSDVLGREIETVTARTMLEHLRR